MAGSEPSFLAGASIVRRAAFQQAGGFSARLWLGGEEELLGTDLLSAGWELCYRDDLTVHHRASPARDATLRRRVGLRNTLWFTWLRRPVGPALRRTAFLARTVPHDRVSALAVWDARRGGPWVLGASPAAPAAGRGTPRDPGRRAAGLPGAPLRLSDGD